MRVLVIGGGGREHALAWKITQSPLVTEVYCCPGNAGTRTIAKNVDLNPSQPTTLALWAAQEEIDLAVVGPEAPLAEGIVDVFNEHGIKVFGPTKQAARLESSKSFAKEIMLKAGIPTPRGEVFDDYQAAKRYLLSREVPVVVKADGLASGKGVVVAKTMEEAQRALEACMLQAGYGEAGKRVLIEEYIDGREASVMALVDGDTVLPLAISQDYKRVGDGDAGPNTGGMGAISPTPVLSERRVENLIGDIFVPVLKELYASNIRYVGFLYAGVIIDRVGAVRVLEFNVRLGDPETQPLLMRMRSDLVAAMTAAVDGRLASVELEWRPEAAACVVAASRGYPGDVEDNKVISGLFEGDSECMVFHAGTRPNPENESEILTRGGRILSVTALGGTLDDALRRAYKGMERISFDGMHYRRDIGGGVKE